MNDETQPKTHAADAHFGRFTALRFFSCDKIPLDVIRDQIRDQREPVKILKKFGVKVNEQTGEIEVFYGGRQIPIQKAGMNYVSNTIINNQVTLAQIRYTPLGCNDFDTANGKNLRTFAVDFRNTSGNTFQYVVPTNVTGSNVFGISGSVSKYRSVNRSVGCVHNCVCSGAENLQYVQFLFRFVRRIYRLNATARSESYVQIDR